MIKTNFDMDAALKQLREGKDLTGKDDILTPLIKRLDLCGWSSFEMVLRYAHMLGEHLKSVACHVDGTILTQNQKQKSPAVSSEALQYVVPEAESTPSFKSLFIMSYFYN